MSKKLIAFYSRADENYVSGTLKFLDVGNTEVAAGIIKDITDADIFKIEQVQPYDKSYNKCIAQAQADQKEMPVLSLKHTLKAQMITILFIWASLIIGALCLWLYLHFWSILILAAK